MGQIDICEVSGQNHKIFDFIDHISVLLEALVQLLDYMVLMAITHLVICVFDGYLQFLGEVSQQTLDLLSVALLQQFPDTADLLIEDTPLSEYESDFFVSLADVVMGEVAAVVEPDELLGELLEKLFQLMEVVLLVPLFVLVDDAVADLDDQALLLD